MLASIAISAAAGGLFGGGLGGLLGGSTPLIGAGSVIGPSPPATHRASGSRRRRRRRVLPALHQHVPALRTAAPADEHVGAVGARAATWRRRSARCGSACSTWCPGWAATSPATSSAPAAASAGASAAIFGLFAALFIVLRRLGRDTSSVIPVIVINVIFSFVPGISIAAHLGGLVTGGVLAVALAYAPPQDPEQGRRPARSCRCWCS